MKRFLLVLFGFLISCSILQAQNAGELDLSFNADGVGFGEGTNGTVRASAIQPDGNILIAGEFRVVNGTARNFIARLTPEGRVDYSFDPGSGANLPIFAMELQDDGKILIGGDFTSYNGVSRNRIARLNSDGSLDESFNPGSGVLGSVNTISVQGGSIFVGGSFQSYNGEPRSNFVALTSVGSINFFFNQFLTFNGSIQKIIRQPDGHILVFGAFFQVDGVSRNRVARITPEGRLDGSFNPGSGANSLVRTAILQADGKIVFGGDFTSYNGQTANRLARINSDGSFDNTYNSSGANFQVWNIQAQPDSKILVSGSFSVINGVSKIGLARLNSDGSLDESFDSGTGTNGPARTFSFLQNGDIFLAGGFNSYNGPISRGLALIDSEGTLKSQFNPESGANNQIRAMKLLSNGNILIGGDFTSYKGNTINRLARLTPTGELDLNFNSGPGPDNLVFSLDEGLNQKTYIGGLFLNVNGVPRNRIARFNPDGTLDNNFDPGIGPNNTVNQVVELPNGKVLIAGLFTQYGGVPVKYIVRLNSDGTFDPTFDTGEGPNSGIVSFLVQPDGKILISGFFTSVDGAPRNYLARLNSDGSLDTSFEVGLGASTTVLSLDLQPDGKILIGGFFVSYNGISRNRIARLNPNGSLDTSFDPQLGAEGAVRAIQGQEDGTIYIGGDFFNYNGTRVNYFAKLTSEGLLDPEFANEIGTSSTGVNTIQVQEDENILIAGSFTSYGNIGRGRIARVLGESQIIEVNKPILSQESLTDVIGDCQVVFEDLIIPTANDVEDGIIQGETDLSIFPITTQGLTTITWTYTDSDGNSISQDQSIILEDITAPVPDVEELPTIEATCFIEIGSPTATDACKGTIQGQADRALTFTETGDYTVTWTYDDGNGNTSSQTQRVIFQADEGPFWITEEGALDQTLTCPTEEEIQQSFFAQVPQPGSLCFPIFVQLDGQPVFEPTDDQGNGVYSVVWYARDPLGARIDYTVRITIVQGGPPVPVVDELPILTASCSIEEIQAPIALDGCSGDEILGITTDPTSYFEQGTFTITWTYDSENGNTSSQSQTIIIEDSTPPVPDVAELPIITAELSATVEAPSATDNCAGNLLGTTVDPITFTEVGEYTVTWNFDDGNGNSTSQIQLITITGPLNPEEDLTPPVVRTQNVNVILGSNGQGTLSPAEVDNGSTDNLTLPENLSLSLSRTNFSCNDVGQPIEVTLTVIDENGNAASGVALVSVLDQTPPELSLKDITIDLDESGSATLSASSFDQGSKDNCSIVNWVLSQSEFTCNDIGVVEVEVTAIDLGGNASSATANVTVRDRISPSFIDLPKSISLTLAEGEEYVIPDFSSFAVDNCEIVFYEQSIPAGTLTTNSGKYDVSINIADASGNTAKATIKISRSAPKIKKSSKRILSNLITVDWNTPIETVQKELDQQSGDWFDGRQIPLILDEAGYEPLTPGLYILNAKLSENDWFELDEAAQIQVLVKEKPLATDILAINSKFAMELTAGTKVADLKTIDPADDIHLYELEAHDQLELRENQLIWKGGPVPAILKFQVSSTDRAGQTISREITLTKELKFGEFLIFPNPAENQTQILVELDQPAQVSLSVFDATGRLVISDQFMREETFVQTLDLMGIAPGLYTIQVQMGDFVMTGRLIKK